MSLNLRKLVIGLLVLGVLLSAYLAYRQVDDSPLVDMDGGEQSPLPLEDPAATEPSGEVGRIAGGELERLADAEFLHTDDSGRVDRKFGFDELLHSEGDQWGITNPYMTLFLGEINCRVTANQGRVQVEETAFGRPQTGDAVFSGNVVIRIVPTDPNDPRAVFVYLDDVAFTADQSLFSTEGAVKFVSRSAQLVGRGMELMYDEPASRLQLFRVRDLESLRLRSDEFGSLSPRRREDETPNDVDTSGAAARRPEAAAEAEVAAQGLESSSAPAEPNRTEPAADVYECIFHRNVTISTPEQHITARDRFTIGNILWSSSRSGEGDKTADAGGGGAAAGTSEPNEADPGNPEPEGVPSAGLAGMDTTPSELLALDAIPESFFDIVIACEGGFVVAPKGSPELLPESNRLGVALSRRFTGLDPASEEPVVDPNLQMVVAQGIEFDASTNDTTLAGPVRITFAVDSNDLTGRESDGELMPVTITARDAVRYFSATDRVQLEGRCAVMLQQSEPNYTYDYMLTAPMLVLDLMEDPNAGPEDTGIALKRFAASGGPVGFNAQRRAGADLIGWVELKASRLDYDEGEKEFSISGPAKISLHNGENLDPEADPNEFSIGRPCYAFMEDFDVLTYSATTNLIVAESESQQILLAYYPQVNGSYVAAGVHADAGRIEIALTEATEGGMQLSSLTASEGISFEDNENQFSGAILFYDHAKGLLTVEGDSVWPCSFNGVYVDWIEMDPKTGNAKARGGAPSTVRIDP